MNYDKIKYVVHAFYIKYKITTLPFDCFNLIEHMGYKT